MKFKSIEVSDRKQIRTSMRRIAQKLIKLNASKIDRLDYSTAFNMWTSRYIKSLYEIRYYGPITVDEELFQDFRSMMQSIFLKESDKQLNVTEAPELKYEKYYIEKPATEKQLSYAKYLMDTIKNEPLPDKKYTMLEISTIINALKSEIKSVSSDS